MMNHWAEPEFSCCFDIRIEMHIANCTAKRCLCINSGAFSTWNIYCLAIHSSIARYWHRAPQNNSYRHRKFPNSSNAQIHVQSSLKELTANQKCHQKITPKRLRKKQIANRSWENNVRQLMYILERAQYEKPIYKFISRAISNENSV